MPWKRHDTYAAIWIAIGGALRLWRLDAMEFKTDEREALTLALDLLAKAPWTTGHGFPTHGMVSSNHVFNPPLFTWVIAAFWSLVSNPVGVAACIAVTNTVFLIPLWLWAKRTLTESSALLTVAIAAVSPFAVLLSRKIWAQDLLFPGLVMLLWAVYWLRTGRVWMGAALMLLAALFVAQLHLSGFLMLPLFAVAVLIQLAQDRRNGAPLAVTRPTAIEAGAIAVAIALHLFFWLPYVTYLLGLSPGQVMQEREVESSAAPMLLLKVAAQIVPTDLMRFFYFDRGEFDNSVVRWLVYRASMLIGAPLCVYGIWRWARSPRKVAVFGYWWWMVVLAFAVLRIKTNFFYTLILAPLPALLAAGAFDRSPAVFDQAWLRLRWLYTGTLAILTALTVIWLANRGGSGGDYGATYQQRRLQAEAIIAFARGSGDAATTADPSLHCAPATDETAWLVRWLDPSADAAIGKVLICDDWTPVSGDREYKWQLIARR